MIKIALKLLRSLFFTEISSWKSLFRIFLFVAFLVALIFVGDMGRVFLIIGMALYLFTTELLPVDMTALLVMILVIVTGLVSPDEGFSGFSNSATLTVLSMFILSAGVERTGLIKKLGGYLLSEAIKSSFNMGSERVWVHTCSLDHKNALKNYLARGMTNFKSEILIR